MANGGEFGWTAQAVGPVSRRAGTSRPTLLELFNMDRQDGQDEVRSETVDRGAVGKLPGMVYHGFNGFHGSVRDGILYILYIQCIHVYSMLFSMGGNCGNTGKHFSMKLIGN